jgi:hypothetical protein
MRKKVICVLTSTRNFAISRFSVSVNAIAEGVATSGSGNDVEVEVEEVESGRSHDSSDEKLYFFISLSVLLLLSTVCRTLKRDESKEDGRWMD